MNGGGALVQFNERELEAEGDVPFFKRGELFEREFQIILSQVTSADEFPSLAHKFEPTLVSPLSSPDLVFDLSSHFFSFC